MPASDPNTVYIVDDDASLRRSLRNLVSSVGFQVQTFESAESFLEGEDLRPAGCLVADLRMPGMGGLALLQHLKAARAPHPAIVLTGHGNDEARQQCVSAGAIAFLEKPFASDDLLDAVQRAMSIVATGAHAADADTSTKSQGMSVNESPIRFARGTLSKHWHICAFFNGPEEEHRVLRSFVMDGIDAGERTVHIVDPEERDAHLEWLRSEGVDVDCEMSRGTLEVHTWKESYLRGDRFDRDVMLQDVEDFLRSNAASGYPRTRMIGHMEWALQDKRGVEDLLEYEATVNGALSKYNTPAICVYDLSKFNASMVIDVLRTHPMVIVGGVLQENPFFVPPDEFLFELRARRLERRTADIAQ
jgi:FixJ family two-component response regulator